jgi:hypothetical protein
MDERFLLIRLFYSGKRRAPPAIRAEPWALNISAVDGLAGAKMMRKSLQRPELGQETCANSGMPKSTEGRIRDLRRI